MGAPEAVLVGVVALVVFGPKGLAEVSLPGDHLCILALLVSCKHSPVGSNHVAGSQAVKSLGKTLKTFQPTIREVMSVSSELRNTLEEQIGLDDIRSEIRSSMVSEPRAEARRQPESVSRAILLVQAEGMLLMTTFCHKEYAIPHSCTTCCFVDSSDLHSLP